MINHKTLCKTIGTSGLTLSYICGGILLFCMIVLSPMYEYTFHFFKFSYAICPFNLSLLGVVAGLFLIPFGEWD